MPAITCPTDCSSLLPAVSFSACAPEVNTSEITDIFLAKATSTAFTNWAQLAEWTTRLAASDDTAIKRLVVSGDKPAPARVEREISNFRKSVTQKTHVVNFTIDETNDINHEFLRSLECGGQYKIWYKTASGHMFGGNSGILSNVFLDMVLARGEGEIAKYEGTAEWKAKFTEERVDSPL